jgi:outer membrane protein assembly factor BamC
VKHLSKLGQQLGLGSAVLALSACSVIATDNKVDYKSAVTTSSLEIPPDLTQLARDSRYSVPGAPVSANALQATAIATKAPVVAAQAFGDVSVERTGNQRWLAVKRSPDQLWEPVRDFWKESGFVLVQEQANLGIMETDWAENRAKLPQDFIRESLGKVLDSLYSTGERDKFRTRLERAPDGSTEIYITHRGMTEVYTSASKDQTTWQTRPADPELEAEFLRRLMVKLGTPKEQAQTALATAAVAAPPKARLVAQGSAPNNTQLIEMDEDFDHAWRRVGLSLDRSGFTVEDRDRTSGLYYVRYVDPKTAAAEPGFFSKLFGSSSVTAAPAKYRIAVRSTAAKTAVSVLDATGMPENSVTAQRILQLLTDDLK